MTTAAVTLEIAGVRIRAPGPVHALLYACQHGAHHSWDRLSWVADVAGLWLRLGPTGHVQACETALRAAG